MKRYIIPDTGAGSHIMARIADLTPGSSMLGRVTYSFRGKHATGTDGCGGFGLERYPLADGNDLDVMTSRTGNGMQIAWGIRTPEGGIKEQGNIHLTNSEETGIKIEMLKMAARHPESPNGYHIEC